jgi:phage tail-like protein
MTAMDVPRGLAGLPVPVGSWAAAALRLPPFLTFNFAVEVEGLLVAGFSEVSGLEGEVSVEEYREGGVNDHAHKLPGQSSQANLVLRHGLTSLSTLWNWYYATTQGDIQRRNGTIILLSPRQIPVMWWNFRNALPVRWTGPALNAASDEAGAESLELAHEGLTVPLLGQAAALASGLSQLAGR